MRRWAAGLGIVLVLGLAAVVFALQNAGRWIETNRDRVAGRVSEAIGRPVSFGAARVALFPTVAVRVADLRVGDDPAWSAEPFVAAKRADVSVALLPALAGRVVVRRVVLHAPVVTVIRGAGGRNVDSLGRGREPRTGRPARAAGGPPAGGGGGGAAAPRPLPLAIAAGSVRDGLLRLVDRRGGREAVVEIHDVDGMVAGVAGDRAASIEGRARMPGGDRQNLALEGTVGPFDLGLLDRTPVDVEVRATGIDVARLRDAIPEVAAAVPRPLGIDGPVDATVSVAGTADAPAFDARLDATRARVTWAEWFAKPPGVPLTLAGRGRQVGAGAHLSELALRLADVLATGRGDASPERVAMQLEAAPAALDSLAALLPALGARRLGGEVGVRVAAEGPVTEGRTPALTGSVTLRDVSMRSDDPPFELAGLTQTIALVGDAAVMPPTTMRVNGEPVVASGRLGRFGSPLLALSDLDVRIFGGRLRGRVEADRTTPERPRLAADLALDGIDVAAAAATRAPGVARAVGGRLSGVVRLAGRGATADALRATLAGDGRLAVADGVLRGVNLVDRVLGGVTRVPGLGMLLSRGLAAKYPAVLGGEDTRFDELSATWRIVDRVVHADRVALAARDYRAEGRGTLGLDGRLAARGTLELAPGLSDAVVGGVREARVLLNAGGRLVVPFAVEGTWPRVRVTPDVAGLGRAVGGGAVREGIEEGVGRLLDGLFKR